MPIAVSVLETIANVLYERLLTLVNNSEYTNNVIEVIRPTRQGNYTPQDMQIVLTQGSSEEIEDLHCPGNPPAIARQQIFNIRCHVVNDENSSEAIDSRLNSIASDVIQSVCYPASTWHNFDGNAIDAAWQQREQVSADGGIDGINVPIAITYRTDETNPYNVRA